jgi:tetratricopeptide (TPR) repeat protein
MATLSRVDAAGFYDDQSAPVDPSDAHSAFFSQVYGSAEDASGVAARPSREFSAYDDTIEMTQEQPTGGGAWLGTLLFVGVMVSIISAAAVVALEEMGQPGLADLARSAVEALPGWQEPATARPAAHAPAAAAAPAVAAATVARGADRLRPEPTSVAAPAASGALQLPEIVVERVDLETQKPAAAAPKRARHAAKSRHAARRVRASQAARAVKVERSPASSAGALSWDAAREAAREAYSAGRFGDAVKAYEQAVRANPHHALTLAGLGAARMQTGDVSGAVDAYQRAAKLAPDNATVLVALARASERAGDVSRARGLYRRVLSLDANHPTARAALERL